MSKGEEPDLAFHEAGEVDGPDDVSFPNFLHHLQVRSELTELSRLGAINPDQGDEIFRDWLDGRQE